LILQYTGIMIYGVPVSL